MFDIGVAERDRTVPVRTPWSTFVPDGLLADMLEESGSSGSGAVDDYEQLERIGAWEKIIGWAQAGQLREIADLVSRAETHPAPGLTRAEAAGSAEAEIALMLRQSAGGAAWKVTEARQIVEHFTATFAALRRGLITLVKARVIADGCADLQPGHAAAVEARVLPRAPHQTNGQLRAAVRRAVLRADPTAAERRHQRKRRERGVGLHPGRDGMATLSAALPAAEAVGIYAVLDEHARRCGADDRSMDARRADALVDLTLRDTGFCSAGSAHQAPTAGPDSAPAQPTTDPTGTASPTDAEGTTLVPRSAHPAASCGVPDPACMPGIVPDGGIATLTNRVSVQVRVTVPLDTLTGAGDEPGDLAGYGPILPSQARELAAHGTWRRLVTDPLSGILLDYGTTRYKPPPDLAELVISRDQTCQHPGCRVPAHRCDLDHTIAFDPENGRGPTSADNLKPQCRTHHRLKQRTGWTVAQYEDGTIVWTTPSRHIYIVQPPPLTELRPSPTPPPDPDPPPF